MKMVSSLCMDKHFITSLKKKLETPQKAVIIPHKNLDGNALGNTLTLLHFLLDKSTLLILVLST